MVSMCRLLLRHKRMMIPRSCSLTLTFLLMTTPRADIYNYKAAIKHQIFFC